ncbi:MAG: hypothetical protein IJE77_14760, partial [Thermoguttaceae bacterium]|nr:hypothetical protein [Thermoguttaceae bacterium]
CVALFEFSLSSPRGKSKKIPEKSNFIFFFFDFGTIVAVKVNLRVGEASGVKKREQLERF